jgi:hypothetical protein
VLTGFIKSPNPVALKPVAAKSLTLCAQGEHAAALALFEEALTLPGSGTLRDRKKQRELSDGQLPGPSSLARPPSWEVFVGNAAGALPVPVSDKPT